MTAWAWYLVTYVLLTLSPLSGEGTLVEGQQLSFEVESRQDDHVQLLNVNAEDRFDYNIQYDDGTYQYGYQSGPLGDQGGHNFKHEYKRDDGVVFGRHGYQLEDGTQQTVNYVADARGFRVLMPGQEYKPVGNADLEKQRNLLGNVAEGDWEEAAPLQLDLALLDQISSPELTTLQSDPEVVLAAEPVQPHSEMDPDTGVFRFRYRSVADDGSVSYRVEERREDGVVLGQYGQRTVGRPARLVSYVSDAFGYRLVDPGRPVAVVSREQALRQLPRSALTVSVPQPQPQPAGSPPVPASEPGRGQAAPAEEETPVGGASIEPAVGADGAAGHYPRPVTQATVGSVPGLLRGVTSDGDALVTDADASPPSASLLQLPRPPYTANAAPFYSYAPYIPYYVPPTWLPGIQAQLLSAPAHSYSEAHQPDQHSHQQQHQWHPYGAWYVPTMFSGPRPYWYAFADGEQGQHPGSTRPFYGYRHPSPESPEKAHSD